MPQDDDLKPLHPLDVLRSGRWSRALFGTYVLSLGFFEAAPLRSLRRAGATDIPILADLAGVAGALGEAGAREVGRTYAVEPVRVPDGCFHPKLLLLDGEAGSPNPPVRTAPISGRSAATTANLKAVI